MIVRTSLLMGALLAGWTFAAETGTSIPLLSPSGPSKDARTWVYGGRTAVSPANAAGSPVAYRGDDREYSGWMLVLPGELDLSAIRDRAFLELRVRGARGGERFFANLVDGQSEEIGAGVQSRQPVLAPSPAGTWTTVRIPLWQFPSTGLRYSNSTRRMWSGNIDWKRIKEFRLSTDRGENKASCGPDGIFQVEVAEIRIATGPGSEPKPDIDAGGLGPRPVGDVAASFVQDAPPASSWDYCYGGSTRALWVDDLRTRRGAVLYRGDDREYAGWTLHIEKPADLSGCLAKGVLKFRIRAPRGGERVTVGLLDASTDGSDRKSQVRMDLSRRIAPGPKWQEVSLPLREFGDVGLWWDPKRQVEVPGRIDWSRIQEFRVSNDRGANTAQRDSTGVFEVQLADVRVERDAHPPWDARAHWATFRSNASPVLVRDTTRAASIVPVRPSGSTWVKCDSIPLRATDWSHHAALQVELTSTVQDLPVQIHVVDSSGETWSTSARIASGRTVSTLPFSRFLTNPLLQDPDARADRRFDLEKVRGLWFSEAGQEDGTRPRVGKVWITNDLSQADSAPIQVLRANSLGWRTNAPKRFLCAVGDRSFALLDSSGRSVFQGDLSPSGWWEASRESLWVGDFSCWTRPGTFRIAVGAFTSAPFRIGENVYDSLARASTRAFFFQRATPLEPAQAGPWARGAHPDTLLRTLEISGGPRTWKAPGGWYDAGDYGKYVVNAGITTWSLLLLDQLFPSDSAARREAFFEVQWLERMQDRDGGVVFKIGPRSWSRFVLPERDTLERLAIGKSTTSALDFAAVLAQASRSLAKSAPARSAKLLEEARKAFNWAAARPFVPAPGESGGTGSYEDQNSTDEFAWAAAEIWLASGKAPDRAELARRMAGIGFNSAPDWQHVQDLALVSLALSGRDDPLVRDARAELEVLSDSVHEALDRSPSRQPLGSFPWGSNSFLLNHGLVLIASHRLTGNTSRLDDLQELLDYALGRNALGRSFVTGFGFQPPRHPHQRLLGGRPAIPGFLVGGPNPGREDELSKEPDGVVYPWSEPARSWVDRTDAYAGNEVGINWNASLAVVVGYLARQGR